MKKTFPFVLFLYLLFCATACKTEYIDTDVSGLAELRREKLVGDWNLELRLVETGDITHDTTFFHTITLNEDGTMMLNDYSMKWLYQNDPEQVAIYPLTFYAIRAGMRFPLTLQVVEYQYDRQVWYTEVERAEYLLGGEHIEFYQKITWVLTKR